MARSIRAPKPLSPKKAEREAKTDLAKGKERLYNMSAGEIIDWIDVSIGGIGRNMSQFRTGRDPVFLYEAELIAELTVYGLVVLHQRIEG